METAEPERESMVEKHESEDGEEEEVEEEEEEEAGDESSEEEGAHSDSESRSEQSRSEGEHQVLSPAHGLSPHPHCASKGSSHKFAFIKNTCYQEKNTLKDTCKKKPAKMTRKF